MQKRTAFSLAGLIVTAVLVFVTVSAADPLERRWEKTGTPVTFTAGTTPPVTRLAPTVDLAGVSRDAYLTVMGSDYPHLSRGQLLDFAGLACTALELSGDPMATAYALDGMRTGLTFEVASATTGAVMGSLYCERIPR